MPQSNEISNPALRAALKALTIEANAENSVAVYAALLQSTLIVPLPSIPRGSSGDPHALEGEHGVLGADASCRLAVFFLRDPKGRLVLPTFSDREALLSFAPDGIYYCALAGAALLPMLLRSTAGALSVNPGSEDGVTIDSSEIANLLQQLVGTGIADALNAQQKLASSSTVQLPLPEDHPLPEESKLAFQTTAHALPLSEAQLMLTQIEAAVNEAVHADSFSSNAPYAQLLADRSRFLIALYPQLNQQEQALVVGAIRYFISDDDALPDSTSFVGLDDDVRVMNHVLARLGIANMLIADDEL